jgi:hypothetical protein
MYFWGMHLLSTFSIWWSFPIIALSILISWRFYQQETWLEKKAKSLKLLLISLRTAVFSIIGILLLGLTLELLQFKSELPIVVSLIDHSSSMLNDEDPKALQQNIANYKQALNEKFKDGYRLDTYYFGSDLQTQSKGFLDQKTNMEMAFEALSTKYFNQNLGAVVLISDGNYNVGAHPSYQAEHLPLTPIYSLAVGDTTLKKDQLIKHIAYNDLTFLNNEFPLEIDIEAYRLAGKTALLSVYEDGQKIHEQRIQHAGKFQSSQTITFQHKAKKAGVREYRFQLSALPGEFTLRNNAKTIYIEVTDSRSKILMLSHAPHPDMAAIAQALKGNENYELIHQTPAKAKGEIKKYDLVIWHEPSNGFDANLLNEIKTNKVATWYILGSQAEMASVKQLPLGLNLQLRQQLEEVQTYAQDGFSLFEPERQWLSLLEQFPPLQRRFGECTTLGATQTLLRQRIGPIQKKDPLLTFSDFNQQRSACLLGEGIWRWKLQAYQKTQRHDAFQSFIGQICSYLLVKKEGMGLRVQAPVRLDSEQDFVFNASFYNASLQAITTPQLKWELRDEKGKIRKGELQAKGSYYQYKIGQLKPGRYNWAVRTTVNGKTYVKTGKLIIEAIQLEQQESAARHATLKQLASQSGGAVFALQDYQSLLKQLQTNEDLVAVRSEIHQFDELNDLIWICLVLISLLAIEWFLRRYHGTY